MQCRVCGVSEAMGYANKRMTMCAGCAKDTPDKVSRAVFDRLYWGVGYERVPMCTRGEFYSDYLHSMHTLDEYVRITAETDYE